MKKNRLKTITPKKVILKNETEGYFIPCTEDDFGENSGRGDSLPLGCYTYSGEFLDSHLGWIKSEGQWNSGEIYTTFYETAVNKIGDDFAGGEIVNSTQAYTNYDLVVNTANETFRLPLLTGSADDSSNLSLFFKAANKVKNAELLDVATVMEQAVLRSQCEEVQCVVETYKNGTSWYRVWSDGWCEQGGSLDSSTNVDIDLLKPFKDINYTITACGGKSLYIVTKTTSKIRIDTNHGESTKYPLNWQACGYIEV